MSRIFPLLAALGAFAPALVAADSSLSQEVHELRRDVQMQAKKIEALSEQILRLTQLAEAAKAAPAPVPMPPPTATTEIVKRPPAPAAPAVAALTAAATAPEPEIPKAEPVPPPIKHMVEKGETLTSIAKHYNIPLTDLQKLNKITNDRKLQIGQTLSVPASKAPEAKTPDAPAAAAEKKENP